MEIKFKQLDLITKLGIIGGLLALFSFLLSMIISLF